MTDMPGSQDPSTARDATPKGDLGVRAFLFCDLRGYSAYADEQGDGAAAALLAKYRQLVRTALSANGGAEIRTEGDGFYVVFPSPVRAVRAALAIVDGAEAATRGQPDRPIRVGVGVHAGVTIEEPEGYIGSAVNIAARLCAQALPGEVLVSDTVRSLIRTSIDAAFVPRGRRRLKGIVEPIEVFAVAGAGPASTSASRTRSRRGAWASDVRGESRRALFGGGLLLACVVVVVALAFGLGPLSRPPASSPSGPMVLPPVDMSTLPAGTYTTAAFKPTLTFTLGPGWRTGGDTADAVGMDPPPIIQMGYQELVFLRLQVVFDDGCPAHAVSVGTTAHDILAVLQARSDLAVSDPTPVVIGGDTAEQVDITVKPNACAADALGVPIWEISKGNESSAVPGAEFRLILVDTGRTIVAIHVYGPGLDDIEARASSLLTTLWIDPSYGP